MENSSSIEEPWYLYVIECDDGRLYTGISNDVEKRFKKHASGKGAIFTRMNRPVRILAKQKYPNKRFAAKAEAQLKKFDRATKLAWVDYHQGRSELATNSESPREFETAHQRH